MPFVVVTTIGLAPLPRSASTPLQQALGKRKDQVTIMTNPLEKVPSAFWTDVALGVIDEQFEFLALKIALSHIRIQARRGADAARSAGEELRTIFAKYQSNPVAQSDLQKLFKKAGIPS